MTPTDYLAFQKPEDLSRWNHGDACIFTTNAAPCSRPWQAIPSMPRIGRFVAPDSPRCVIPRKQSGGRHK